MNKYFLITTTYVIITSNTNLDVNINNNNKRYEGAKKREGEGK